MTLDLPAEAQARLQAEATRRGITLDQLIAELAHQLPAEGEHPKHRLGFVGIGIGAALNGLRPIIEVMTVNFSLLALDQIVNNAATMLHMSGGQFNVPLVIRTTTGAGRQLAAQHSHSLEGWFAHIPGIRVVTPSGSELTNTVITNLRERSRWGEIVVYASGVGA